MKMGLTIPKENKKVILDKIEENPVIVPCRKKNYLLAEQEDVTVLDAEVQPRIFRRIVVR
jgi:hypothetical protein